MRRIQPGTGPGFFKIADEGWGGTFGHLLTAVRELQEDGKSIALAHFNYIFPLPKNTEEVLKRYKKIVVCELNDGQFAEYLRSNLRTG